MGKVVKYAWNLPDIACDLAGLALLKNPVIAGYRLVSISHAAAKLLSFVCEGRYVVQWRTTMFGRQRNLC
jgi:hypothetical protein